MKIHPTTLAILLIAMVSAIAASLYGMIGSDTVLSFIVMTIVTVTALSRVYDPSIQLIMVILALVACILAAGVGDVRELLPPCGVIAGLFIGGIISSIVKWE